METALAATAAQSAHDAWNVKGDPVAGASGSGDNDADIIACGFPQGHSILIAWNSAIIENTQDNISKSSVFIDADVLGCINMRHQTTFNALYSAPDEPCGCRNSHMHINEIFVSNDPERDDCEPASVLPVQIPARRKYNHRRHYIRLANIARSRLRAIQLIHEFAVFLV